MMTVFTATLKPICFLLGNDNIVKVILIFTTNRLSDTIDFRLVKNISTNNILVEENLFLSSDHSIIIFIASNKIIDQLNSALFLYRPMIGKRFDLNVWPKIVNMIKKK